MTSEDLRAGVQAGILSEAQAAALKTLIEARAGQRSAMPAEDEPFEFFKGFSEIFISMGLVILLSGVMSLIGWAGGATIAIVMPLIAAGIAWWWAGYFTLKRRMNLPSMVLALVFGGGLLTTVGAFVLQDMGQPSRMLMVLPPLVATLGMAAWYYRFRLPFSMFVLGGFALATLYALTASSEAVLGLVIGSGTGAMNGLFDLRESPAFAFATLAFGIVAFLAGMWFDMRDPHRLGRNAATAFWLHLLAAFALVNTVAVTLHGAGGMLLLIFALLVIMMLALVIDRRSFVSAAIGYMAIVIVWATGGEDFGSWAFALLILGALITAIGTWWVQLRFWLMRNLPDFPGKDRLPPYSRPE